jgi:3-deoxy-D-manno-octulosonate 8-phosphate phosphatase (KDO 8-P phosphatase)
MALSPAAATERARSVRVLLLDVDGVLTDGAITLSSDGTESKQFSIRDGAALVWAQREGITVGLLSGRPSEVTTRRADELGIRLVVQSHARKNEGYNQLLAANGFEDSHVAYMGDDLLDLPVLSRVGLAAAPADAAEEVRARVHWLSTRPGGHGAVRELVEFILGAQGRWDGIVQSLAGPGQD